MATPANMRVARIVFGLGALAFISMGLAIYVFADRLGFDRDTAQLLAIVFTVVGIVDVIVLSLWSKLFKPRA